MIDNSICVHLWEFALSPHLGNVLKGLADRGYQTRYVVHSDTYAHRKAEGWVPPEFPGVEILQPSSVKEIRDLIFQSSPEDVHICVGLRGNDFMRNVVASLRRADRRYMVFMETISERQRWSRLKRPLYYALFRHNQRCIEAVLAAGSDTSNWVAARGLSRSRIFDFAYFLPSSKTQLVPRHDDEPYRLLYVGSLIPRKRVRLIIEALSGLPDCVTLDIVGDGPLRPELQTLADRTAPGRVVFHGVRPMPEISDFMVKADCLVLASDHDGWGAVISEAMLVGTPVVCSDRCGASVVVRASGRGKVFPTFVPGACEDALREQVALGPITFAERASLAKWGGCLTEPAGAEYLDAIIAHVRHDAVRPIPPWAKLAEEVLSNRN